MFSPAAGRHQVGRLLDNPVLRTEARVTLIDGVLALAVLGGLVAHAALGWWWAEPVSAFVVVGYAAREARACLR